MAAFPSVVPIVVSGSCYFPIWSPLRCLDLPMWWLNFPMWSPEGGWISNVVAAFPNVIEVPGLPM